MTQLSYGPFITRAEAKAQGLKLYFTGRTCKNGHTTARRVSTKQCVPCSIAWAAQHRANFPERHKQNATLNRLRNAERIAEWHRHYRRSEAGKSVIQKRQSQPGYWEKRHEVLKANPQRHLKQKLGALMRAHFAQRNKKKSDRTVALLGAPLSVACAHIELLFQPGMTWDNHGEWHFDHIRPVASFDDVADPACWHYTNLQPLWAADNLAKSDKWEAVAA